MVQEVETTSWFTRIKNSFIGIIFGIILIFAAIFLIFWNEGNGLRTAQSLEQAQKILVSIPNAPISSGNNLKAVYLSGLATTNENLTDPIFGTFEKAIKLDRSVKMYQWKENVETTTEHETGGSEKETKNYTYEKVWSDEIIDSSEFKDMTGHTNPTRMLIQSKTQYADHVTVGDFILPLDLTKKIDAPVSIDLSKIDLAPLKAKVNKPVASVSDKIYVGTEPNSPEIGDLEISLSEVLPQTVSIIAQQTDNTLQPYLAPAGHNVMLLEIGQHSSTEMIMNAESENRMITWLLRGASLLMLIIGIALLMQPIVVLADVLPFLGSIVGFGTGFIAFTVGLILWTLFTAIAWFAVRPLLSIGMFAIVMIICGILYSLKKKQSANKP